MANFDWAVEVVLHHEGGFVDHPDDPGGVTNFGISLRYLQTRGDLDNDDLVDGDLDGDGDVDRDDIVKLSRADAIELYRSGFWTPNRCGEIQSGILATKIFDMAVNMGSRQAWRIVQRACNRHPAITRKLVIDGIVGKNTLSALNSLTRQDYLLLGAIREEQKSFYLKLIDRKPRLDAFRLGWMRRAVS